jgi:DNA processing protein
MASNELLLALARCEFLSWREKAFFAKNLDNLESLTVLSIEDICLAAGRHIKTRCWQPESLADLVDRDLETMQKYGIRFVTFSSPEYPPLLREIHDPPFSVFYRGTLPDPEKPLAAIVGTRSPSGDGALTAARIAREFGEAGIAVVSGLARGIDAFAHRGNVDGSGASVGVLACGVERIYPRSNAVLAARMIGSGGCLLSEYPPGELPFPYRFPARNRIVSGLSRAVIVVEAPEKSGALITADFALEQGRDLFVCRDTLGSARGAGSRTLYNDGAQAISAACEVLSGWGLTSPSREIGLQDVPAQPSAPKESVPRGSATGRQLAFEFREELSRAEKKLRWI